jgi:dienelactone hydrolase
MKIQIPFFILFFSFQFGFSQKKPLDHSVYDGWESIGERTISADGKYLAYSVVQQQGDGRLLIQSTETNWKKEIPRGYNVIISSDSRYAIFQIKALFKETREARIKKKNTDQFPKDSLGWLELGKDSIEKIPRIKSYEVPEKAGGWVAWLTEKPLASTGTPGVSADSVSRLNSLLLEADSLSRVADSLRMKVTQIKQKGFPTSKKQTHLPTETIEEGTWLVLKNLNSGKENKYPLISEYHFSKNGKSLILKTTRKNADSLTKAMILFVHTQDLKADTIMTGFNDAGKFAFDEEGNQLAFVAERDSVPKALVKFYRLWYYKPGMDSAHIQADRNMGFNDGLTISPDYENQFSQNGKRLFFGLAPIRPPKDTTLVDFETARLDVWNYQDDYLQPQQLVQLNNDLKKSQLSFVNEEDKTLTVLGDENSDTIIVAQEGNGNFALGQNDKEFRIRQQWEFNGLENLFLIDLKSGSRRPVQQNVREGGTISPQGKFILWYDWVNKNWFTYATANGKISNITKDIRVPLYDEEDDHPDAPPPHGIMGWKQDDQYVYIYDKYDVWQCDPTGEKKSVNLTEGAGRAARVSFRYVRLDKDEHFLKEGQLALFVLFNNRDKTRGLHLFRIGMAGSWEIPNLKPFLTVGKTLTQGETNIVDSRSVIEGPTYPVSFAGFFKAKGNWVLGYLKGSFDKPYDLFIVKDIDTSTDQGLNSWENDLVTTKEPREAAGLRIKQMSQINPQQKLYNWFSVDLCHWKMFDGKMSEGLLYKPENFDSTKKYPIIFYFYERDADTRYVYIAPRPSASIINIAYFVSNGYLVFDPDIHYKAGQPGEEAYNSVVSAAKWFTKFKWVDSSKMALEGHSWGGYQVAYLITRTQIFAAAEAGAPVANMISAYGGIRWGSGISRQFQYEKGQSRLGASLWQRPDLYIKNSPLFRADKVTTPLLMMHNDADGAVPWYQGIEYFSALKRLGKKVWLMEYNGENHGLIERRNRMDWSIRLAQFFAYYLKGENPPKWITQGVPATLKGIDWGLSTSPTKGTE